MGFSLERTYLHMRIYYSFAYKISIYFLRLLKSALWIKSIPFHSTAHWYIHLFIASCWCFFCCRIVVPWESEKLSPEFLRSPDIAHCWDVKERFSKLLHKFKVKKNVLEVPWKYCCPKNVIYNESYCNIIRFYIIFYIIVIL